MCMLSLVIFQQEKKNVNTVSLQNIKKSQQIILWFKKKGCYGSCQWQKSGKIAAEILETVVIIMSRMNWILLLQKYQGFYLGVLKPPTPPPPQKIRPLDPPLPPGSTPTPLGSTPLPWIHPSPLGSPLSSMHPASLQVTLGRDQEMAQGWSDQTIKAGPCCPNKTNLL